MKTPDSLRMTLFLALLATAACSDDDNGPDTDPATCTTDITAADADAFVQLCAVDGGARHVRIDNLVAPATHASTQVVFGFDAPPPRPRSHSSPTSSASCSTAAAHPPRQHSSRQVGAARMPRSMETRPS